MDKRKLFIILIPIIAGFYLGSLLITNLSMALYIVTIISLVMYFVIKKNWIFILALLTLFSLGIIDETKLPRIPLPIGTLIISDVLYILLSIKVFTGIFNDSWRKLHTPIILPLMMVIASMVIASIIKAADSGQIIDILYGLRRTLPFTFFIIFMYVVKNAKDLDRAYSGFIIVALINSIFLTLHYIGAIEILERYPLFKIEENPRRWLEYYRYISSGFGIIVVAFITSIIKDYKMNKFLRLIVLVILGLPILLSFSITFWISIIGSIFLTFIVLNRQKLASKFIRTLFLVAFLIILIPVLLQLSGKYSFVTLLSDVHERTGHKYTEISMEGRIIEARFAMKLIKEHPLIGNGISPEFWNGEFFVNSAHIGLIDIWLQLGLLGLFSVFWFIAASLKRIRYVYKNIDSTYYKSFVFASFSIILSFVLASLFSNQFFYAVWPICLGFFIGGTEYIWQLYCEEKIIKKESKNLQRII